MISVATDLLLWLLSIFFTAAISSWFRIFVQKGRYLELFLVFVRKLLCLEYKMVKLLCVISGSDQQNLELFLEWQSIELTTGLPSGSFLFTFSTKIVLFFEASWKRLEEVSNVTIIHLPRRFQDVFSMSSKCLHQDECLLGYMLCNNSDVM